MHSFADIPPDSLDVLQVATVPDTGHTYRAFRLLLGVRYYYCVRCVRSWDGTTEYSGLSSEVDLAPRPSGNLVLWEEALPTGGTCVSLAKGEVLPLDPSDPSGIADRDLYFGTSDSLDGAGTLRLKSVSLLANRNPAWAGRRIKLKAIGTNWNVNTTSDTLWTDHATVVVGEVYAILLPEGNYAKVQVTSVVGVYPRRQIQLQWAYQLIPGYARF